MEWQVHLTRSLITRMHHSMTPTCSFRPYIVTKAGCREVIRSLILNSLSPWMMVMVKPLDLYIFMMLLRASMIAFVDLDFIGVAVMKLTLLVFVARNGYPFT
jgi:hypothetical protein